MTKKLRLLFGGVSLLIVSVGPFTFLNQNAENEVTQSIEAQREAHAKIVANSPFKETLTWDKRKRKKEGLPPNRYFEQMWELTVNPSTGKLDDGNLTVLREQIMQDRASERNPGEAGNDWEERGPNDIGGRTRAMLFDPNDSSNNTVFAGGVSGGLWKNTNITSASSQWERVQNVPGNLSVTSITVDPNNTNRWYVGTGEQYTAGDVVGNGVYVSNDGGNSWNSLNIPPAGAGTFEFNASNLFLSGIFYVNDIVAWNNNGNTELFVGVGAHVYGDASNPTNWLGLQTAGLYRSTNNGSTWSRIETSNLQFDFQGTPYPIIPNDFEIGADGKLWMGTITTPGIGGGGGGRVFSSSNGATWSEAGASPLPDSNRVEIAVSSSNANKMYALTQGAGAAPVHVYTTTNGFASISNGALPNDADQGIPANDFCRGQAFYDLMIEVDPNNDNILYVGGIDLFRSSNGAGSWTQISKWSNNPGLNTLSAPLVHADQHAMTFRPGNSNQAVFGNDGGIYYASSLSAASGNGNAIGVRNNNYNVTQYVKAGIGPNGSGSANVIFTAGAQDNGSQAFRNGNAAPGINGSEELSDGDGFYTFVDKDGQYMIATFVNNVIYRFNLPWNGQGRRQGGSTTLSSDQSRGDFVNQMGYDSDANRLLTNNSSGANFAIKSINVASNSNGSITNAALTAKPTAFRASPFANNTWYVGLANGGLLRLTGVSNSSATFTTINTPFVGSVSSVRYGATANDIFVTIHNYGVASVWATSNGGNSWQNKEGNLPNLPVRDMLQNPLDRDEAILATQLGVWSTSNFNATNPSWTQAYNGMSDASVTSFDYWAVNGDDNNNQIIASTYGRGVFTGTFTANTVADTEAPVITLNGPSTITLNVGDSYNEQGATATDNVDGNLTSSISISGSVNTNVANTYILNYNVSDAAGNAATTVNRTVNVNAVTTTCSNQISTFPYAEGFENGIGNWTQSSSDDIDWTVDANGTPSNGTGPSSAVEGNNYIYVEASGNGAGFPNKRAIITSPCFDLSSTTQPVFAFQYHMFGSTDGGSVDLEVTDDNGATWTSLWSQSGNQGNQWLNIDIDLLAYVGSSIQLRFNRITGGTWESDVAIDAITLVNNIPTSTSCSGGINTFPYAEGFENGIGNWTQSSNDDIDWTVDANGTPSNGTGPSSAVEGNNYIYVEASGNGSGFPNKRAIITSPCFDLSSTTQPVFAFQYHMFGSTDGGSVDLEVTDDNGATWTSLWSQSGNQGNQWLSVEVDLAVYIGSSVQLRFNRITGGTWESDLAIDDLVLTDSDPLPPSCSGGVTSFPYNQSFEGSIGDWSQSNNDDINWTVDANGTPSNGTGPSNATRGTRYIFVEASGNGSGFPNKSAIINSPCYDLSSQSGATFNFDYHMFGAADMGSITLEASNDNGISWTTLWSETGNKGNQWLTQSIDLSSFVGNSVQLRFNRITGSTWQADIALDNINLLIGTPTRANEVFVDDLTDVTLNTIESSVRFYPNPASASVNVDLDLDMQNGPVDITLMIYDLTGKMVNRFEWSASTSTSEKQINISNLNSGIYMLNIEGSNGFRKTQKLMKK